jgi:hypothetical protein
MPEIDRTFASRLRDFPSETPVAQLTRHANPPIVAWILTLEKLNAGL